MALTIVEASRFHKRLPYPHAINTFKRDETLREFCGPDEAIDVQLRAYEIRDWYYYNPPNSFRYSTPFYADSLEKMYKKIFIKGSNQNYQQRSFDLLEAAATDARPEKHSGCVDPDHLVKLLTYPMMYSTGGFLQNDAMKVSYNYIMDGQSSLNWQAEMLQNFAKAVAPQRPLEAEWLSDKALLLEREFAQEKIYSGFMEKIGECVKMRDYDATMQVMKDHEAELKNYNNDLSRAQERFGLEHPTPAIFA